MDFIHKLGLVQKEAAETEYWLEVANDAGLGKKAVAISLAREANELLRIFGSARRTSKERQNVNRKSQIVNRNYFFRRLVAQPSTIFWGTRERARESGGTSLVTVVPAPT